MSLDFDVELSDSCLALSSDESLIKEDIREMYKEMLECGVSERDAAYFYVHYAVNVASLRLGVEFNDLLSIFQLDSGFCIVSLNSVSDVPVVSDFFQKIGLNVKFDNLVGNAEVLSVNKEKESYQLFCLVVSVT